MEDTDERITPACSGQTAEQIEEWLRANVAPGLEIVIRDTQHHILHYRRVVVDGTGRGCFYIRDPGNLLGGTGGLRWYYSGRNSWAPKGQSRVVIPTAAVLAACEKRDGWFLGVEWRKITAH